NAAEILGIRNPSCRKLLRAPPGGAPWFWGGQEPSEIASARARINASDNREHGVLLGGDHGDPFFGPVSRDKGDLEFRRLTRVYESIKRRGFNVDKDGYNNIRGFCLVSDKHRTSKLMIVQGHHRIAALAALGRTHA